MDTTSGTPKFSQLRILVDDFPASFRFYRNVLGLAPQSPEQESGPYACFKATATGTATESGTDVALISRSLMQASIGDAAGSAAGAAISAGGAVLVLKVDDVDSAYEKAVADGAQGVAEPVDQPSWGMRVAHVRAPEGTIVEFCAY